MSTGTSEPRAARQFSVRYSTGKPPASGEPLRNTFGLMGEGKLVVDETSLTFEAKSSRIFDSLRRAPRFALSNVANVDYNPENGGFVLRTRKGRHYVILWATSREDADAIWALLPQEKSPEFLEEQAAYARFYKVMAALRKRCFVTPTVIALNVALFIILLASGADLFQPNPAIHIRFGSNFGPLTWTGQEWRLLTSAFLHFGIIHIAVNMYSLSQLGRLVEPLFGSTRFALIYLLSALSGSVVSGWWDPFRNSAGASGAIFGVLGALLAFMLVRGADIPRRSLKSIAISTLLFGSFSLGVGAAHPLIDNACHVGGLLGGFIAGLILARPFTIEAHAVRQPTKLAIAVVVIALPLAWAAHSLLAPNGPHAAGLRFNRDLYEFIPVENELVRRQAVILTFNSNERVNRLEIAKRLRNDVLTPWRTASRSILVSATIADQESESAKLQTAWRTYLRAREESIALKALGFETGNPSDVTNAEAAERRQDEALNAVDALMQE